MSDHTIVIILVMKIFFVQFFCVFLPPLLISSASVRSRPFLSLIEPIFAWNVPLVSLIFLKRFLVFPILLFSSVSLHWYWRRLSYLFLLFLGTLHSDACIFPFLLCFSPLFFSQLFVRPPQNPNENKPWIQSHWVRINLFFNFHDIIYVPFISPKKKKKMSEVIWYWNLKTLKII